MLSRANKALASHPSDATNLPSACGMQQFHKCTVRQQDVFAGLPSEVEASRCLTKLKSLFCEWPALIVPGAYYVSLWTVSRR